MPVLAAKRERKARRIRKSGRRSVNDFRNKRKRLQRPRPELFEQQEFRKIMKLAFVGDSQHGAEPFQIDIECLNFVPAWQTSSAAPPAMVVIGFCRTMSSRADLRRLGLLDRRDS